MFRKIIYLSLSLSLAINVYFFLKSNVVLLDTKVLPVDNEHRLLAPTSSFLPIDGNSDGGIILDLVNLRQKLEKIFNTQDDYESKKIGLYVQLVHSGTWIGINEREQFIPASLLKVPIAMAIYSLIEHNELSLDDKIIIENKDIDVLAGVPERYIAGDKKTVRELLELMLKVSDNTAKNILRRQLKPEELNSVFAHVAIPNPYTETDGNGGVSPRGFVRLFKALYYSTYLDRDHSEEILDLLTDTKTENLLSKNIPWEVQVSHKYGERNDMLHDCGIVYEQSNPYFICIMTRDIDLNIAQNLISQISLETYNYIKEK